MISSIDMGKITSFINGLIDHGTYTIAGTTKTIDIYNTDVTGNVITKYLYLADTDAGTVTDIKLIDINGDVFSDRPDNIVKVANKGILVSFKFSISEV